MTTYEAISTCSIANRAFWTERARMNLVLSKVHYQDARMSATYRQAFRSAMQDRRNQTYYKEPRA